MDTQEVERIRARVDGNVSDAYSAHDDVVEEFIDEELVQARADLRTLLRIIDQQQGVIQAAGEFGPFLAEVMRQNEGNMKLFIARNTFWYKLNDVKLMYADIKALHDALAALEGTQDGEGA
jgi:hypothetical protein